MLSLTYDVDHASYISFNCPFCNDPQLYMESYVCDCCFEILPDITTVIEKVDYRLSLYKDKMGIMD